MDRIVTGASRGIGRALALSVAQRFPADRVIAIARDRARLDELAHTIRARGGQALALAGDLGTLASARELGERLAAVVEPGATLVHNAGLWPTRRVLTSDGFERAFTINHLGPLELQRPLLERKQLRRVMVVSAGLIALGRFDAARTPTGADFSRLRTYATTKLCFAIEMRRLAAAHPELDVVALHPGVVRTELGALDGPLGWLLELAKRRWESPEACAARLTRILERERWSTPGQASWLFEEEARPWPSSALREQTAHAVHAITAELVRSSTQHANFAHG